MQLVTKAIERAAPALYSTEPIAPEDKIVVAKFFDPTGRYTYYMVEYDPVERRMFGYCVSALGPDCDEWGYTSLEELEEVKGRFGLGIERDIHFTRMPIGRVILGIN